MPLDVQPLSPQRRAVMVAFMAALFAGSLGFAQLLVNQRRNRVEVRMGILTSVVAGNVPINNSIDGGLAAIPFRYDGAPCQMAAFNLKTAGAADDDAVKACLADLYAKLTGDDAGGIPEPIETTLAGLRALQISRNFGAVPPADTDGLTVMAALVAPEPPAQTAASFVVLRAAAVEDRIFAISFQGKGPLSDNQRAFFDDYCQRNVRIWTQQPGKQKG